MPLTETQRAKKVTTEAKFQEAGTAWEGMRAVFHRLNEVDQDPELTFTDAQLAGRYNAARDALEAAAHAMPRVGA
jgi:hypothetical protein